MTVTVKMTKYEIETKWPFYTVLWLAVCSVGDCVQSQLTNGSIESILSSFRITKRSGKQNWLRTGSACAVVVSCLSWALRG